MSSTSSTAAKSNEKPLSAKRICDALRAASFTELPELIVRYKCDSRVQVQRACDVAARRVLREQVERDRVSEMYRFERVLGGKGIILGVDEVGRGSIAGPLTVCAVALPAEPKIWGLNDSKQLTPARREELAAQIAEMAQAVGIAHIEPATIDALGMAACLRQAVAQAIAATGVEPDCVLLDGNRLGAHPKEKNVVKGDARIASIAAASIVAKVCRDELMCTYDLQYPGYHLAACKGYGSPDHIAAVRSKGLTPLHRRSFCEGILAG